jgi:hypothetical protein
MEIANSKKRFVYLLHMNFMKQDFYKIGVFTGYVASRISKILDDIDHIVPITCVRKWQLEGMTDHFGIPVKKNYQVELNAQHYLFGFRHFLKWEEKQNGLQVFQKNNVYPLFYPLFVGMNPILQKLLMNL